MYSAITGTGDGSTIPVVNLTWDYLAKSHVKGSVNGVEVGITWTGASQVTFDAAPANGAEWRIYRETPADPMVDFTNGAVLVESDLDLATRQPLYRQDEIDFIIADDTAQAAASAAAAAASAASITGDVAAAAISATNAATSETDAAASAAAALAASTALSAYPRRLTYGFQKPIRTIRRARDKMSGLEGETALHLEIVGYAANPTVGTAVTGGYGKTEYYVDKPYLDASIPNSFGWAVAKAKAGGGGLIYFDPRSRFDILLMDDTTTLRFDAGQDNITIYAPGRNVTIWTSPLTSNIMLQNKNMIWKNIVFRSAAGPMSGDFDGLGLKSEIDLVTLFPHMIDRIAFDGCEFRHSSDGALDIASTLLTAASNPAHVTIQNSIFWDTDEAVLLGTSDDNSHTNETHLTDATKLFVTFFNNGWMYNGQRHPKVQGRTFVDVVQSYFLMEQWQRDQPSPTNEFGSQVGINVTGGGKALVRGSLFTSAVPLAGVKATSATANINTGETGAIVVTDSYAEDGITFDTLNTGSITVPAYTLPYTAPPAVAGPARDDWVAARLASIGGRPDAAPDGVFEWTTDTSLQPNGDSVLIERGQAGRWRRIDSRVEYPAVNIQRAGSYTPVTDTPTNVATVTMRAASWRRDDAGYVTVEGQFDLQSTAAGDTQFRVTLPVPTTFATTQELSGQIIGYAGAAISGGGIIGVVIAGGKALFRPFTGTASSRTYTYRFTYKVNV